MSRPAVLQPPNLMSLARIALTLPIVFFIARQDVTGTHVAAVLLIVAGFTDMFDGLLARWLNQTTELGKILDPLADKLMAAVLIVVLILYRDFPLWLAGVIVGRDIIILVAASLLLRGRRPVVASTLTGKWAFGAIALLLGCYLYRLPIASVIAVWATLVLLLLSTFVYARRFMRLRRGLPEPEFHDRMLFKMARYIGLAAFIIWIVYEWLIVVAHVELPL